jgi:hypothetical protein
MLSGQQSTVPVGSIWVQLKRLGHHSSYIRLQGLPHGGDRSQLPPRSSHAPQQPQSTGQLPQLSPPSQESLPQQGTGAGLTQDAGRSAPVQVFRSVRVPAQELQPSVHPPQLVTGSHWQTGHVPAAQVPERQEPSAQQGWVSPPHGAQVPAVQTASASHAPAQHGSPRAPHEVHVPAWQVARAPHAPPAQHGSLGPPHDVHVPAAQVAPAPHAPPAQHGSLGPPQEVHVPDSHDAPGSQRSPAQHGVPGAPHA